MCEETFSSKAARRNHVRNHLMNTHEYTCDLCNKKFQNLEDAQAHATKPCGHIRESGIYVENEEPEDNIEFDCTKCEVIFNSQSDYYRVFFLNGTH
jgi:hypothetical protein